MNLGELDSLIERGRELPGADKLPTDPLELRRWADAAAALILDLRSAVEERVRKEGGMLAMQLRQLFEARIVKQVNGRALLTDEVAEHSLIVHVLEECVIVDVRLRVGKAKEDGTARDDGGETR